MDGDRPIGSPAAGGWLSRYAPLRAFELNSGGEGFEERADVFGDLWGRFYAVDLPASRAGFVGTGRSWEVGDLLAGHAAYGDLSLGFDPRRSSYDPDQVFLYLNLAGMSVSEAGSLGAGWICLRDFAAPWSESYLDYEYAGVLMPRAAIGYDPSRHGFIRVHAATPKGRVLEATILCFLARLPHVSAFEAPGLASEFAEVVRSLMLPPPMRANGAVLRKARRVAIERYIDEMIEGGVTGDAALSPERLGRTFGLSRASLYRCFEPRGGVERYVRDRRLLRCLKALGESEGRRGDVRRVAERWGFHDTGNFHRGFRARFGVAPAEVLRAAPSDLDPPRIAPPRPGTPLVISRFADWLPRRSSP